MGDIYDDMLEEEGFRRIGSLDYQLKLGIWWHQRVNIQVIRMPLGSKSLLKGDKAYYMKSITEDGETYVRDIPPLQTYLEAHFPELHLSFSHFRDITPGLAATQIKRKLSTETPSVIVPSVDQLAQLQRELENQRLNLQSIDDLMDMDTGSSDLLQSHMKEQTKVTQQKIKDIKEQVSREKDRLSLFNNMQKEYERKGSAACFVFSISSNIHLTTSPPEFRDALVSIVKELTDAHRYQVTQKLCGGRLNIHIAEAEEPVLTWIEQWLGGALSPRQANRLKDDFRMLRDAAEKHMMVTPDEDIRVDGNIKDDKKLMGARVTSTLLRRLDRPEQTGMNLKDIPKSAMPAKVGLVISNKIVTTTPFFLPLSRTHNGYISGTTGSGKSYAGRVIVEEAAQYDDLNILVLDPRNQAAGLLVPEDRESILSLYPEFGMKPTDAKGFDFKYFAPAQAFGEELPTDLSQLGRGRNIVSFKGLDDRKRCELFAKIQDEVFEAYAGEESDSLRLLMVVEEAQRFTKKRVTDDAKSAGEKAEIALDRTLREGRKYGDGTFILSQTIRDFAYDSASIRQNTNTKIFLHNSDREVDYAANFIGDGRQIIRLTPGTAIVYNSTWGSVQVKVRPPLSKVWEFSAEDTSKLVTGSVPIVVLSSDAEQLLAGVRQYYSETGSGINLSQASEHLGLSSKRQLQQIVDELERAGLVKSRKLRERGQPRIIEPISSGGVD